MLILLFKREKIKHFLINPQKGTYSKELKSVRQKDNLHFFTHYKTTHDSQKQKQVRKSPIGDKESMKRIFNGTLLRYKKMDFCYLRHHGWPFVLCELADTQRQAVHYLIPVIKLKEYRKEEYVRYNCQKRPSQDPCNVSCHKPWWHELDPHHPHGGRRELAFMCCLLVLPMIHGRHSYTFTRTCPKYVHFKILKSNFTFWSYF